MALSGSFRNSYSGYTVRTEWVAVQNISNNYSDLTVTMYLDISSNYTLYINSRTHTITVDGTNYSISSPSINGSGSIILGSITKRIYHNNDGTKELTISSSFDLRATINGIYKDNIPGGNTTVTLDKIPRMSVISDTMQGTRELGTSHTITIIKNLSDVVHTLWYRIRGELGESSWYKIGENIGTTVTFTPNINHIELQPNSSTIYMDIKCSTYKNGKKIGEDTYNNGWYMKVPLDLVPIISDVNVSEAVEKVKKLGVYVQNHSKLKIVTTTSGIRGSTIKSVTVNVDNSNYSGSNIITSEIKTSGNIVVKIIVIDTRDRKVTITRTVKIESYSLPTIKEFSVSRLEYDERTVNILRNFTSSNILNKNTVTWKLEKRVLGTNNWSVIDSGTDYTLNNSKEYYNISSDYEYEFKLTLTDLFSQDSRTYIVFTAFSLIEFHKDGKGLSIGRSATVPDILDVDLNTQFRKDVEFKRIPKINGTPIIRKAQTVSLQNGWIRVENTVPMRVIKDFNGVVHIQGIIRNGATDWGTTLFTLPEIYRPNRMIYSYVILDDYSMGGIRIETDGRVRKTFGSNEQWKKWACFDTVSYFVD